MLKLIITMSKILNPTPIYCAPIDEGESHNLMGIGFLYL
jgi:hypothetical protein